MREAMLIIHLIGLTMGLGTSFAFLFLGKAASRLEKGEAMKFVLNTLSLSRMGHIGLTLSIITGFYLMTPFWKLLPAQPLLIAKLVLVLTLTLIIVIMSVAAGKAKKGEADQLKKIRSLGRVAFLTGLAIVILAVLVFH